LWQRDAAVVLVPSMDALDLRRDEGYEDVPAREALRIFDKMDRLPSWEMRDFAARARLPRVYLHETDDQQLLFMIRQAIADSRLIAFRKSDGAGKTTSETVERRRLVRQIEQQTRGRLNFSGRQYKLVVDVDLGKVPGRDNYEVVGREDARRVLGGLAKQSGTAGDLVGWLTSAIEKLTPDWRPPRQPDGLILLRRIKAQVAPIDSAEPALTPSQLKKLARKTDWIEVEVVDQDGEPYTGQPYHFELPDATSSDGNFNEEGFLGNYELDPGHCKLTLTDGEEVASAADVAPAAEPTASAAEAAPSTSDVPPISATETTDPSPIKLRFKLLDLAANPVSGASVTVAGSSLTTDGDGMVEAEVADGASSVTATLPSGDIGLAVGSLDPSADTSWKARLFNLGFLWDPSADDTDDEMAIALQDFQAQYQIPLSGQADDATKAKLVEVYGC